MSVIRPARVAAVVIAAVAAIAVAGFTPRSGMAAGPTLPAEPDLPDAAVDMGDVVVVTGANSDDELSAGDSNSVFSVRLPDGATCPGDSANDGWRVQTFVVPADNDLGTLRYGATRPRGDFMYALYTTEGRPYAQILLAQNPAPGQPGQILPMPALSFAPFTPDLLPVGRYRIGVACSYFEVGERYWDAEIELTEDRDVAPGQRRWQVVGASVVTGDKAADADDSIAFGPALLGLAGVGAVLALIGVVLTSRRRTPTPVKEHAR